MRVEQIICKIRTINFFQLLIIVFYAVMHKIYVLWEKIYLIFRSNAYNTNKVKCDIDNLDRLNYLFPTYFCFCDFSDVESILQEADNIRAGKIVLFGKLFSIKHNEWLCDPVTKKLWASNTFFMESRIVSAGFSDVKYVMELNKMYHLVSLAKAYYITHDEKYVVDIATWVNSWSSCVKYEKSIVNKISLDVVFRCINLIHVSFLCYDSNYYKTFVYKKIMNILFLSERQIRKFATPRWRKYSTGANHTIGEMVGLIIMHNWFEVFGINISKRHTVCSYKYLNNSLSNIVTKEGVYLEQSSAYSKLVCEFLVLLDIFSTSSLFKDERNKLYNKKYLESLLRYVVVLSNHGTHPNFGDNDSARFLTTFNAKYGSMSHLEKYAKYMGCNVPTYIACNESGQFVWNSDNLYMFIRSGRFSFLPAGANTHAHNDILSLILSYRGHDIFVDRGTYLYNSGMDYYTANVGTAFHNTVYLENKEQAPVCSKWIYSSHPESTIDAIDVCDGFIFQGRTEYASGVQHCRRINYISEKSQLLIQDTIKCDDNEIVTINFMLSPSLCVQVREHTNEHYLTCNSEIIARFICDETLQLEVKEIDYFPQYGIKERTHMLHFVSKKRGSQSMGFVLIFV